jgi:hypothetical protein
VIHTEATLGPGPEGCGLSTEGVPGGSHPELTEEWTEVGLAWVTNNPKSPHLPKSRSSCGVLKGHGLRGPTGLGCISLRCHQDTQPRVAHLPPLGVCLVILRNKVGQPTSLGCTHAYALGGDSNRVAILSIGKKKS